MLVSGKRSTRIEHPVPDRRNLGTQLDFILGTASEEHPGPGRPCTRAAEYLTNQH